MTGIERLRTIAGAWDEWGLGGSLTEIADEIERERAEDCYRMGLDCGTVWRVVADMERHCLGHEGMEDSPVARWARELRGALKSDTSDGSDGEKPSCPGCHDAADATFGGPKVTRDPAEDVSMSAYDLLPSDERDAIAWVRDHGGLSHVKDIYHDFRAVVERLGIEWSESELHGLMDALDRRLMPEGIGWPRHESGEPVGFGDEVSRLGEVFSISLYRDGSFALNFRAFSKGERVRRPAPKVLDADGVDTSVGDTVYDVDTGEKMWVCALPEQGAYQCVKLRLINGMSTALDPCRFTHRAPVLAADGKPLEVGQTVWDENGDELVIGAIEDGGHTVTCRYADVGDGIPTHGMWSPSDLTHQRPDSWERWRSDLESAALGYAQDAYHGLETSIDFDGFVRRCRALAERERGE